MNRRVASLVPLSIVGLVALAPSEALAWKHVGHVWLYENMPVDYVVTPKEGYQGFSSDELIDTTVAGFQAWNDAAPCADYRSNFVGVGDPENRDENNGFKQDGVNRFTFDDPVKDLAEAGTLAATLTRTQSGAGRVVSGKFYRAASESDIVFNDQVSFVSTDEIEAGTCRQAYSLYATMVHEIGHWMGMGHSCDEGEFCSDEAKRTATMFWTGEPCSLRRDDLNQDDIDGINAIYGPSVNFRCSNELEPGVEGTIAFGVVGESGFELSCGVVTETKDEIVSAEWNWGDGTVTTGVDGTHTYTEPGNYTITVTFEGERPTCATEENPDGLWEFTQRRTSYVRVCGLPEPEFSVEADEGLAYVFRNDTPIEIYGCVYDVQWDVFKGDSTEGEPVVSLASWEPTFEFPEPGQYTVVLNVGGPAGTSAAKLTVDAVNTGARGACSTVPAGTAAGLLAMVGLAAAARRRRR